jgi:hypothetical protein
MARPSRLELATLCLEGILGHFVGDGAIRANVQTLHPDDPKRVRKVCRSVYRTKEAIGSSLFFFASSASASNVRACCFLRVLGSTCPLAVCADQTHPSSGFSAAFHLASRIALTLGVIGSIRRVADVLPCVTKSEPCRPLDHVRDSQRRRKHSSGRIPVSMSTVAIEHKGSGAAGL